jgi:hypothetical protein
MPRPRAGRAEDLCPAIRLGSSIDADADSRRSNFTREAFARVEQRVGKETIDAPDVAEFGFKRIHAYYIGKEQRRFIDDFGERVLPTSAGSVS